MSEHNVCREGVGVTLKNWPEACGFAKNNVSTILKQFKSIAQKTALLSSAALMPICFPQSASAQVVPSAADSTLTPFTCGPNFYEVIGDQLSILDPTQNPAVYTPIGPAATSNYNATGFSVSDNYVYGITNANAWGTENGHLLRIGSDGAFEVLNDISTEVASAGSAGQGVMVGDRLYFGRAQPTLGYVDVVTGVSGTVTLSSSLPDALGDFSHVQSGGDDYLIGINLGNIYRINLSTLTFSVIGRAITGLPRQKTWGASWSTSDGTVYFSSNDSGTVYIIGGATSSAPYIIDTVAAAKSSAHDGMNCLNGGSPFDGVPQLTVTKTASPLSDVVNVGDIITYNFEVQNTGPISIKDVVPLEAGVTVDGAAGTGVLSAITIVTEAGFISTDSDADNRVDSLAAGETAKFEAIYTLSQADIDAMYTASAPLTAIDNSATATGLPNIGALAPVVASVVETGVAPEPELTLTKIADDDTDVLAGDTITYTYSIENTGNVNIADVTIDDQHTSFLTGTTTLPVLGETGDAGNSAGSTDATANDGTWDLLAPGDIITFTSTYDVTAADVAAGTDITNIATATGAPEGGVLTDPTVNETVTVSKPGGTIPSTPTELCEWNWNRWDVPNGYVFNALTSYSPTRYNFEKSATNLGADMWYSPFQPADAENIALGDNVSPTESNSATTSENFYGVGYYVAEPGTSKTVEFTDFGRADGHAISIFDSNGDQIGRLPSAADVAAGQFYISGPSQDPESSPLGTDWVQSVTFTVPNDGEYYIHNIVVDENNLFANVTNDACQKPDITLAKLADDDSGRKAGDTVLYTYTVENTGDLKINDVSVSDAHTSASGTAALPVSGESGDSGNSANSTDGTANDGSWDVLAPGDSVTFTSSYVVTEADVIAGNDLTNTATVTGTPVAGDLPTGPITADEVVTLAVTVADISVTKTNTSGVNGEVDQASDTLTSGDSTTYTVGVTNNGPDSVTGVLVTDTVVEGLTCEATDTVTITGDGVPTGSFTIGDLTGAGITLETLADGEAATLTYTCEVN